MFFWLISDATKITPYFLNLDIGEKSSETKEFFSAFLDRFHHFDRVGRLHQSFRSPLIQTPFFEIVPIVWNPPRAAHYSIFNFGVINFWSFELVMYRFRGWCILLYRQKQLVKVLNNCWAADV